MDKEWTLIDLINVLSLVIGIENLELNKQQINELDTHLTNQDTKLLAKIINQNDEIIRLLKEMKDAQKIN